MADDYGKLPPAENRDSLTAEETALVERVHGEFGEETVVLARAKLPGGPGEPCLRVVVYVDGVMTYWCADAVNAILAERFYRRIG
jgi:hypothetical protein